MNTKLTLSLDQQIIAKSKTYARMRKTSISKLIENYLQKLTDEPQKKKDISPTVKSLTGIIKLPKDYDPKKAYSDYLLFKYK